MAQREHWGSKLGVILAVAGSAVGLGNFLRFPSMATQNGGGAFMVPYFIAFLLLGIPLMWVEWSLGRMGGVKGHGTAPGIFDTVSPRPLVKYFGTLGLIGPFVILIYYMYIEAWTLGYAWFSVSGDLFSNSNPEGFKKFLFDFIGVNDGSSVITAYGFFIATFLVNFYFIYKGVSGGIEKLSRVGMPIMIIIGVLLMIRVLTLDAPVATHPEQNVSNALGFFWNPDFSKLSDINVWIAATGQIFFTLSVGIGVILTYASYLTHKDDIAHSGLTAASTNEFCEVILGGSIVIPAAFLFFGASGAMDVAKSGTFNLGFVTMPLIFGQIPLGHLFSALWFLLLFIAAITSSVSLIQPLISFMEDEYCISRQRATVILGAVAFMACQPAIFFLKHGFVDELDFWGGSMFLIVFATIETILFAWVLGMDKGWDEMHKGAAIRIPGFYKYIIKFVTPLYLLTLLGIWSYQQLWPTLIMKNVSAADKPYVWGARALIVALWAAIAVLVAMAWRKRTCAVLPSGEEDKR